MKRERGWRLATVRRWFRTVAIHDCLLFNFVVVFSSINDAGGKLPPVSMTPAANLQPVSFTPVANNGTNYQTADSLKWTWKKKFLYANSTTQRCPEKIIKIFVIVDFLCLLPVSLTPVANLELRISTRIFKKIWNGLNGLIRGLGETDLWKN